MRWKAGLVVGFAVGFVLGARAGRETYERLVAQGRKAMHSQPVEEARAGMAATMAETMEQTGAHAADLVHKVTPGST